MGGSIQHSTLNISLMILETSERGRSMFNSRTVLICALFALALPLAAQEKPNIETKTDLNAEPRNSFSVDYEYEHYQKNALDPWRLYTGELSHKFGFGSVIARVNRAHRFAEWGTQYEVDAYPHLMPGMYAYLNAG